jgi:hypothetical protein
MMTTMEPATTARFALAARLLSDAARAQGLRAPGFRSPPRLVGADRTLRERPGGTTVAVRVRGRPWLPVLVDMVEGAVAANRLTGAPAARARETLWHAVAATVPDVAGAASPSELPSGSPWSSSDRQVA